MAKSERRKHILGHLRANKVVTYIELVSRFGVSNMTIRRDIDMLAEEGKVIKVVGGAQWTGAPRDMYETEVTSRLAINNAEKNAIALEAIKHIGHDEIIYIDGSSTCLQLANKITEHLSAITVVTNSVLVYMELARNKEISIICLGGQHDPVSYCLAGPQTETQAGSYFVDKAFISTKAFSPDEGTFESSVATFKIKQITAKNCTEVILLADHTKFGQRSLCKVLDISQIDTVITDSLIAPEQLKTLKENVENVIIVEADRLTKVRD